MEDRWKKLREEAENMPLSDLARMTLYESYTPGIHDTILLKRLKEIEVLITQLKNNKLGR